MSICRQTLPWQRCQYVSLANTAKIAGRSHGWVRRAVQTGHLDAFELATGGPPVVSVVSLRNLLAASKPIEPHAVPAGRRAPLRVVADNT